MMKTHRTVLILLVTLATLSATDKTTSNFTQSFRDTKHPKRFTPYQLNKNSQTTEEKDTRPVLFCYSDVSVISLRNILLQTSEGERKKMTVIVTEPEAYISRRLCKSITHHISPENFMAWIELVEKLGNTRTLAPLSAYPSGPFRSYIRTPTPEG